MLPWKSKLNGPPEQCQGNSAPVRGRAGGKGPSGSQWSISHLMANTRTAPLRFLHWSWCPLGQDPRSHRDVPSCPLNKASQGQGLRGFMAASPRAVHHPRMVFPEQPLVSTQYSRSNVRPLEQRKGGCLSEIPPTEQQVPRSNNTKTLQRLPLLQKKS